MTNLKKKITINSLLRVSIDRSSKFINFSGTISIKKIYSYKNLFLNYWLHGFKNQYLTTSFV